MIEKTNDVGHTEYWYTATEVAQIVGMRDGRGKIIGRNKFIAMLRQNGVLKENNMPYQYYVNLGFVQMYAVQKWHQHYIPIFSETFIEYCKKKVARGEWKYLHSKKEVITHFVNLNDII